MHLPGPWAPPAGLERPSLPAANHFWVQQLPSLLWTMAEPAVSRLPLKFKGCTYIFMGKVFLVTFSLKSNIHTEKFTNCKRAAWCI